MLRNTHDLPPSGFFVYVPETGWTSTKHVGLDAAARELQKHRAANPRFGWKTDLPTCEQAVLAYTEARLRAMKGGERWLTESSPDTPVFTSRPRRADRGALVAEAGKPGAVKKIVAGIGLMLDFLGPTLQAVDHATAENRAKVCSDCPNNKPGGIVSDAAGEGLRLLLQSRSSYDLFTSYDEKLGSCDACDCNLKLKPHVQLDYILSRLTPAQRAALDSRCWMLAEEKALNTETARYIPTPEEEARMAQ